MATTYNNPKSTHDHTNKDTNSQSIIKLNIDKNALCNNLQLPIDGLSDDAKKILESVTETYQCSRDIVLSAMYAAKDRRTHFSAKHYSADTAKWAQVKPDAQLSLFGEG